MTQALELTGAQHVLEIGTGSGYQAAVLSLLAVVSGPKKLKARHLRAPAIARDAIEIRRSAAIVST